MWLTVYQKQLITDIIQTCQWNTTTTTATTTTTTTNNKTTTTKQQQQQQHIYLHVKMTKLSI